MKRVLPVIVWAISIALSSTSQAADGDWPTHNYGHDGQRFSPLSEINKDNVGTLKRACIADLGDNGSYQPGPVVIDGVLYVSTAHTTVAINAKTCAPLWRQVYEPEEDEAAPINRGVAVQDGRVYRGTGDGRLLAYDAKTGNLVWKVKLAEPGQGEFFSSVPLIWKGKLFIGIGGSDWGVRGRMLGVDAATGKELWRWYSVPVGNEPGAETWEPRESAHRGGGGFWTTYTLDEKTGELFIPVANPAPDFSIGPGVREGANLYTDLLVVLDSETGKMKWYHQFSPNDPWDYDIGAAPMLYESADGPRVAVGSKDGHLYILDRDSHKVLHKVPVTTVYDNTNLKPTPEGVKMCPGALGGIEWNGPAYDTANKSVVVGSVDMCMIYMSDKPNYIAGGGYYGGHNRPFGDAVGWVTSVDAETGKVRWKFKADAPVVAAITPTAGGVVFGADLKGNFWAFSSADGKVLFKDHVKSGIAGGIVTYTVEGKQYVAITPGNVSRATFQGKGTPQVMIYTLGLSENAQQSVAVGEQKIHFSGDDKSPGKAGFRDNCSVCHGANGEGGTCPKLQGLGKTIGLAKIEDAIKHPKGAMPDLGLEDSAIKAIAEYVATLN